ncbi:hypothetical protein [Oleiagrimonas sp.]|jgi:hypothetical protein|uniref:hypothetical protein n=1 Tax=Oleiagrimonas sp. TaxID=2010330 RepID=UPI002623A027|nr:hypothetical protein [Oleiagrimonas sp.]MDA3915261.1 hypothetical protein [Oleiagrimonas sp.]
MRKLVMISMLALASVFALSACGKKTNVGQQSHQAAKLTRPTNTTNKSVWQPYLIQVLQSGDTMKGMTGDRPYVYYVAGGDSDSDTAERGRQLGNVTDTLERGVLPGNLMAFAGPSSSKTADLMVSAFKDIKPGSLDKVIVVFIGDQADEQRVADVVKPTGAIFRFKQM